MNSGTNVSVLYREFTDALTEVLAENAAGPARRGRLARAHAAIKKHPDLRIPAIVTTHSDGSRPPVPIDRDQFDGAVRCIF
jgi:hypothetical protein